MPLAEGDYALNGAFTPNGRGVVLDFENGTSVMVELGSSKIRQSYGARIEMAKTTVNWSSRTSVGSSLAQSPKAAVTPDNRLLVHAGPDNVIRVYEVVGGKQLASFAGHEGTILAVAISNDSQYAATASTDTTVLIWKLPVR